MGIVYRAVQTSLNRPVALKMTLEHIAASDEYLERFKKEAESYAELNDRHFVQIYEFGQTEGRPYMALEFVEGGSLEQYREGEPQIVEFSAKLVQTLARTMHKAHVAGLVHRDLKPHNVLLTPEGMPKITDFGLVKRQNQETAMTEHGRVMGTASYMAPEQSRGSDDVGPATDIHALGAILYCLLTGRPPFLAATVYDTILQVRNEAPVLPSQLRADVPKDLETICLKCLQKETYRRYASAAELADDLRRYLEGRPIIARPVSVTERSWRWAKRNPWVAGLGTSVAVLLVVVALVSSLMSWRLSFKNQQLAFQTAQAVENNEQAIRNAKEAQEHRGVAVAEKHLALESVHDAMYYVDNELRDSPEEHDARMRLFQLIWERLEKIRELGDKNPLGDRNEAIGRQRYGDIYLATLRLDEAHKEYERSYEILKRLAGVDPDAAIHQSNLAAALNKLAEVQWRLGNTFKARDYYQQGLQYRQRWAKMHPERPDGKQAVAQSYAYLGKMNLALGQPAAAFECFDNARKEWRKVPKDFVMRAGVYRQLAHLQQRLGETYYQLENLDEAEKLLKASFKKRTVLVENNRRDRFIDDLCLSRMALGDFYLCGQKDPQQAWTEYQPALKDFQKLWEARPESARTRTTLAAIHYRLGATLQRAKEMELELDGAEHAAAQTHFEKSRKLRAELAQIDPTDMQSKLEWALALARCGRTAEAEKLAGELIEKGKDNPRLLSQAAFVLALCSASVEETVATRCRDAAIGTVKKAIAAGWKDWVALRDDPDLDPIRDDAELIELQRVLRASATVAANTSTDNTP